MKSILVIDNMRGSGITGKIIRLIHTMFYSDINFNNIIKYI